MKKIAFLFIYCFLFFYFSACRKEKQLPTWLPGEMTFGHMEALRNGQPWLGSVAGRNTYPGAETSYIIGGTVDEYGYEREHLAIQTIPHVPGRYPVREKEHTETDVWDGACHATFSLVDGDIIEYIYKADNRYAEHNYVEVLEYDSLTRQLRGRFDIVFRLKWPDTEAKAIPGSVYFSEGTFDIYLQE